MATDRVVGAGSTQGNARGSGYDRAADDWYREPSWVVDALLKVETFDDVVWDPACGSGTIPKAVIASGGKAIGSDIADRGYGRPNSDFFAFRGPCSRHIISNPPYDVLQKWVQHSLALTSGKVAVIARIAFLNGQARRPWFLSTPLAQVWVCSRRPSMPPGASDAPAKGGSVDYAWFVWDHAHKGVPRLGWLP